jgi:large subunit ribosomal protein L13
MSTFMAKKDAVDRDWFLVDAQGKVLGRLAREIAHRLRGKHKAIFTPHADAGDFVVVINAEKIALTGKKVSDKIYYHHSGYPGGIKAWPANKLLVKKPQELIRRAVQGMLPKNSLGRQQLRKLKIYAGSKHPHEAQKPHLLEL